MKGLIQGFMVFGIIVCVATPRATAADYSRILLSAAVPGLGQVRDGQTAKGLGLMGAGVLALHYYLTQVGLYNSHVDNTVALQQRYDILAGTSYNDRMDLKDEWRRSYEKAQDAEAFTMPLLGVCALVWVASAVDAYLLPPSGTADGSAGIGERLHYYAAMYDHTPQVLVAVAF